MMGNKFKVAAVLLLLVAITQTMVVFNCVPETHELCCFPGNPPFDSTEPQGWSVYPNATCNDDNGTITVQMIFNTSSLNDLRFNMFYVCTNTAGNTTREQQRLDLPTVGAAENTNIAVLDETFLQSGASCTLFGCYGPPSHLVSVDDLKIYEMDNGTCSFAARVPATTAMPTAATTPQPTNTVVHNDQTTFTSASPSVTPSPAVQEPNPHTVDSHQATTIAIVVVLLSIAGLSVVVLLGILLKLCQVQRKRQSLMWFYNYSEPIDPYFNPISITAPVKPAVSVVSVFDTFSPAKPHSDDLDDNKLEVLQGTGQTEENSSMKSIVFKDDSGVVLSSQAPSEDTSPSDEDSGFKEYTDSMVNSNGYVSNAPTDNQQSTQVCDGYVLEAKSNVSSTSPLQSVVCIEVGLSSTSPLQSVVSGEADVSSTSPLQSVVSGDYIVESTAHAMQPNIQTQQKQFRIKLNSASSGYVTDLSTPEYRSYPGGCNVTFGSDIDDTETNEPSLKPSECKYTTLNNGYMIVESQLHLKSKIPPEEDLDPVYCNEDLEDSSSEEGEELDSENVVTECSLSINPLHFEPVNYDELMQGHTSPSYVNTVAVFSTQ